MPLPKCSPTAVALTLLLFTGLIFLAEVAHYLSHGVYAPHVGVGILLGGASASSSSPASPAGPVLLPASSPPRPTPALAPPLPGLSLPYRRWTHPSLHNSTLSVHTLLCYVWVVLGSYQLWSKGRRGFGPRFHALAGYVAALSISLGVLLANYSVPVTIPAVHTILGRPLFDGALWVAWGATVANLVEGILAARRGDLKQHRAFMLDAVISTSAAAVYRVLVMGELQMESWWAAGEWGVAGRTAVAGTAMRAMRANSTALKPIDGGDGDPCILACVHESSILLTLLISLSLFNACMRNSTAARRAMILLLLVFLADVFFIRATGACSLPPLPNAGGVGGEGGEGAEGAEGGEGGEGLDSGAVGGHGERWVEGMMGWIEGMGGGRRVDLFSWKDTVEVQAANRRWLNIHMAGIDIPMMVRP